MSHLIFVSSFTRFAGPNNHMLDVCNYLYEKLGVDLTLVTHNSRFETEFKGSIRFPVIPVLVGGSSTPHERLISAPANISLVRKLVGSSGSTQQNVFVNASIDTLFEVHWATGRRVCTGYNVLFNKRHSLIFGFMDRVAARYAIRKIAAHTQTQRKVYLALGIPDENVDVIPHCVDSGRIQSSVDLESEMMEPSRKPVIFYGGRLVPEKGVKELVASYEALCEKTPATLIICGDGPLRNWVLRRKETIERWRGQKPEIIVLPNQPASRFLRIMAGASIVVLPTHFDMFGLVILEAMCLRKPVVAAAAGGPSEIIDDGVNGRLVRPRDVHQLEESLLELVEDRNLRKKMGAKAFETIQSKYDVSKVAPRFLKFLEDR